MVIQMKAIDSPQRATIPSEPRSPANKTRSPASKPRLTRHAPLDNFTLKDTPALSLSIIIDCLNQDEYGDGLLFAELFSGLCAYDHTDKTWYLWQGHYWKADKKDFIHHLVSGILASTYIQAVAEINVQIAQEKRARGDDSESEKIKKLQATSKALYARSHSLKTISRMKNVLSFASTCLGVTSDIWDAGKWILGTETGVIELRTGTLRPGKPEDYIKTVIPTKWQGLRLNCPRFETFLTEIFADRPEPERADLIAFLQRALGYALTGTAREHVFLMLLGDEGRNGKDTLLSVVEKVLGDTVGAVSNDVLIATPKFANPGTAKPHLVSLQGKRIAWASETEKGEKFATGQVKLITGEGKIATRQLYGKEYTFSPSHLLVLLTNNKPHADSKDTAFWSRICPIIFNERFVSNPDPSNPHEHKADTTLKDALEGEASGILAWLVRGCMLWQQKTLLIPQCVLADREKYRNEEDTVGIFLKDECVVNIQCEVKAIALYSKYVMWCEVNNIKPMSGTSFGSGIAKMYPRKRLLNGNYYTGIGLQSEYPLLELADQEEPEPTPSSNTSIPLDHSSNGHIHEQVPGQDTTKNTPAHERITFGKVGMKRPAKCPYCKGTEFNLSDNQWHCMNASCSFVSDGK